MQSKGTIKTESIIYEGPGGTFEGTVSWDEAITGPRPGVLVSHAFGGQSTFDTDKAELLAAMGYVGFAIDVYGQGRRAIITEDAAALMGELTDDRDLLARRMIAALDTLKEMSLVEASKTAAIGFCFGGKCVLDLARAGGELAGVVSFHGLYDRPPHSSTDPIKPAVLVLHGWDDPLASPAATIELAKELTERKADWQICAYGQTGHAFTNPKAQSPEQGMFYNPVTAKRAWRAMSDFLGDIFL